MLKKIGLIFLCCLLLGCLAMPTRPKLQPIVKFSGSAANVNYGSIVIYALDERESKVAGYRYKEGLSAPIEISEDLAPVLRQSFIAMAKHHGYSLASDTFMTGRVISAKLLGFTNVLSSQPFSSSFKTDIAIEVDAQNGGRHFEHIYRYSAERQVFIMEEEVELQKQLNLALSKLLSQIAADRNLWSFIR